MCTITSASASILINFFENYYTPPCVQHYLSYQIIMNINNQDTFLQLYYATNIILGK